MPIPEGSGSGDQLQSQAVLICVAVHVRVGWWATGGALPRESTQDIDRQGRPLPVAGTPCALLCQASQLCGRPCRHPGSGPLACLSPHQVYTKAYEP